MHYAHKQAQQNVAALTKFPPLLTEQLENNKSSKLIHRPT